MFTEMDQINEDKIMINPMRYNHNIEDDDEVIVLRPNQINYVQEENNSLHLNIVEKLVLLALMLFGRHYLNIHF